jgi:hypothetical protein
MEYNGLRKYAIGAIIVARGIKLCNKKDYKNMPNLL